MTVSMNADDFIRCLCKVRCKVRLFDEYADTRNGYSYQEWDRRTVSNPSFACLVA
jgi:hypothetical protein